LDSGFVRNLGDYFCFSHCLMNLIYYGISLTTY
jgi:hypothetical protein